MDVFEYGNPNASLILLQMIGDHDIEMIDHEFDLIQKAVSDELCLIACKVDDWNRDLSPWKAPAVFKSESFGENAAKTLSEVLTYIGEKKQPCIIGGYSLAGLFALWAATKTDRFSKVAAASPSVWFPGFTEYIKENNIEDPKIYTEKQTGTNTNRPELKAMLKAMGKGDLLVIWALDRLSRNYNDCKKLWSDITGRGIDIHVITMPLLDTRNFKGPMEVFINDLIVSILSYVGQQETELRRERAIAGLKAMKVKDGKRISVKTGKPIGRPNMIYPKNFEAIMKQQQDKEISLKQALAALDMPKSSYYKLVNQWKKDNTK